MKQVAWSAFSSRLLEWFEGNRRSFPWREPESGPWRVLLSELLLRQTDAKRVVPVFEALAAAAPEPAALLKIDKLQLERILTPIGLQHQRALGLRELASTLVAMHGGSVPPGRKDLLSLPHVGPYAAGAVAVFCRGERAALPDVNTARVGGRYFGLPTRTRAERHAVARRVERHAPTPYIRDFYLAVLDLSALICRPAPRCRECPLVRGCRYGRKAGATSLRR
jgi:A/G-specific adenine glycosylase